VAIVSGNASAIEKPGFELLEKDGRFELRRYDPIPVASAPMDGMAARNGSFRQLFRYISGANEVESKIAMTAPVIMEDGPTDQPDGAEGAMSFMLPAAVAAAGAPQPAADEVTLRTLPGGKVAVLRFKGWTSEEQRVQASAELRAWVETKGWTAEGEPIFAFYDPPWKPELLRRNEVWLRVR